MAVLDVTVAPDAVENAGRAATMIHRVTCPILPIEVFAEVDSSNVGNGVGLVRGLKLLRRLAEMRVFGRYSLADSARPFEKQHR
jgi:hypothetical protein